jgi:hypothetical protein
MLIRIIYTLILTISLSTVYSQKLGRALLYAHPKPGDFLTDTFNRLIHNDFKSKLVTYDYVLYDWNNELQTIKLNKASEGKEKPSEYVVYMQPLFRFNTNPKLVIETDTIGKATNVYFDLFSSISMNFKTIDVATSKILRVQPKIVLADNKSRLAIGDFVKEFGGDPGLMRKNSPKTFNEVENRVKAKYAGRVRDEYLKRASDFKGFVNDLHREISRLDVPIFEVTPIDNIAEKSVKKVQVKMKEILPVNKDMGFDILAKRKLDSYHYYERLTTVYAKNINGGVIDASTFLTGSKDLAEAFRNKDEIVAIFADDEYALNSLNKLPNLKPVSATFKKNCLFCQVTNEFYMTKSPAFTIVERKGPELKYFAQLLKKEDFIDYSIEDLQGKNIGAELLVIAENDFITAIDLSTNKNLITIKNKEKFLGLRFEGDVCFDDLTRIMHEYQPGKHEIQLIKVLEQKKDKIDEVMLFNPIGFDYAEKFDICTLESEQVDGEEIIRVNKIGDGRIGKMLSLHMAKFKVKNGEKELFSAIQAKKQVIFRFKL